jgi:two-component system sensor histidine kinase ChvG
MSLQSDGFRYARTLSNSIAERTAGLRDGLRPGVGAARTAIARVFDALTTSWLAREISRTIGRRIVAANVFGLLILLIGWLVLSQQNIWLIDAKRDALETQSRIMAVAVSSSARLRAEASGALQSFDPDRIAEAAIESLTAPPKSLSALDFDLRPEAIAPVIAKLMEGTDMRARVYATDGASIVDSNDFIRPDGLLDPTREQEQNPYRKPKNFWTRFLKWRLASGLAVYQDLDGINGRSYPEVRQTLEDGKTRSMLLLPDSGEQIVAIVAPVVLGGKVSGVLMLSTAPGEIDDLLFSERLRVITFAILALIATVGASILLARMVGGPLKRLSEAADAVASDITASDKLPSFNDREDEVGQLSRSFDEMTLKLRRRLETSERFAADVAHELKNPLAAAKSMAEALQYARTDAQREECVEQINKELHRLNRLISDVSNAGRLDAELSLQETQDLDLVQVTNSVAGIFTDILSGDELGRTVRQVARIDTASADVRGHEGRLDQVFTNLVDNAVSFSPEGGTVTLRLTESETAYRVAVEDEGRGIAPDQLEMIFKRFYTFRPTEHSSRGNNSGLGLSITREIVEAHNGRIWAENRTGPDGAVLGARFVVELPKKRTTTTRTTQWSGRKRA